MSQIKAFADAVKLATGDRWLWVFVDYCEWIYVFEHMYNNYNMLQTNFYL